MHTKIFGRPEPETQIVSDARVADEIEAQLFFRALDKRSDLDHANRLAVDCSNAWLREGTDDLLGELRALTIAAMRARVAWQEAAAAHQRALNAEAK